MVWRRSRVSRNRFDHKKLSWRIQLTVACMMATTGRVDPIPLPDKMDSLGLGKASIETRMLDEVIAKRPKVLESQRIANETEEQRVVRETKIMSHAEVSAEIRESLSKFHCSICDKGYANVAQWEEHLQSYGHNHAKRKHELSKQSKEAKNSASEVNKRREIERRREERELQRMVRAAGGHGSSSISASQKPGVKPVQVDASSHPPSTPEPSSRPKTGFFKVAGSDASALVTLSTPSGQTGGFKPISSDPSAPPMPPSMSNVSTSPSGGDSASLIRNVPRFTQSTTLPASWKTTNESKEPSSIPNMSSLPRQADLAQSWKPSLAPELHPLLAGTSQANEHARRDVRNDLFAQDRRNDSTPFELPTVASSINTTRQHRGMQFVSSKSSHSIASPSVPASQPSMSLSGSQAIKKKQFDMHVDDDDNDEPSEPMPIGRPKARMPRGGGKIGFGKLT